MAQSKLDEVVSLAKRRGFVFPAGEIYGGTRSAWDYGPLGVALKDNIKREWWRSMVVTRPDVVGVDTSIILPPEVWVASGHVSVFNDPLVECLNCHKRNRADKLEESYAEKHGDKMPENGMKDIVCPNCGKPMVVKFGRYGKFIACSGYPECKNRAENRQRYGCKVPEVRRQDHREKIEARPCVLRLRQLPEVRFRLLGRAVRQDLPGLR